MVLSSCGFGFSSLPFLRGIYSIKSFFTSNLERWLYGLRELGLNLFFRSGLSFLSRVGGFFMPESSGGLTGLRFSTFTSNIALLSIGCFRSDSPQVGYREGDEDPESWPLCVCVNDALLPEILDELFESFLFSRLILGTDAEWFSYYSRAWY